MNFPPAKVRGENSWGDTTAPSSQSLQMDMDLDDEEEDILRVRRKALMQDMLDIDSFIASRLCNAKRRPIKKSRSQHARPHYTQSCWYLMLQEPTISDPDSRIGKLFRRRFRVPYSIFQRLVGFATDWFPHPATDVAGRPCVPVELKVLGFLRVLGRGVCFDDIQELSGYAFFNCDAWRFVKLLSTHSQ